MGPINSSGAHTRTYRVIRLNHHDILRSAQ